MKTYSVSAEEYGEHSRNYEGICLTCGEWRENTEPDAEDYPCEECGDSKVMGVELALLTGHLMIAD